MKPAYKSLIFSLLAFFLSHVGFSQATVRGTVLDAKIGEPLIGATILVKGTATGGVTDYDGFFEVRASSLPATLVVSYSGYATREIEVKTASEKLKIEMEENVTMIAAVEIVGQRIGEKQKASPLTVEKLDAISIKETAASSFYNGLGNLKGVDLMTASLGFTIVNTRGFNSTSPVRSLQIIDGVDNQAPGLNFSLGNFLGCSDLDVQSVDLIVGASSAFYGPNAFNGVISMESKSPFNVRGLAVSLKGGERNLLEGAVRWADSWKNKSGKDFAALKLNFFHLRANDWVADNYDAVDGSRSKTGNPGGWDKVNVYGDEFFSGNDYSSTNLSRDYPGLGVWHRTGYKESDLVDYDTRNYKASAALHFRTRPDEENNSPELIFASSFGSGTTVYQGDNRFSLRNILFFQNRVELRKKDKWFVKFYTTRDNAGDSYDPYFTALRLQNAAKTDADWSKDYASFWAKNYRTRAKELGYPQPYIDFSTVPPTLVFDQNAADAWTIKYADTVAAWHAVTHAFADKKNNTISTSSDFYQPGTERFQTLFDSIRNTLASQGGTKFYDKSTLYHLQGEYKFQPTFVDVITVGASSRLYTPISKGTIFKDTSYSLTSLEIGAYVGAEKEFWDKRLRASATIRADQNFEDLQKHIVDLDRKAASHFIYTPAASLVYKPVANNYLRISFSSALRNPTLTDKYLSLNVGRAVLSGNLNGVEHLATVSSFLDSFLRSPAPQPSQIDYFDIRAVRPERVKTIEVGYRTTLWNKIYVDAGYYYSFYNDFLGYNIGLKVELDPMVPSIPKSVQAYRFAANSTNQVTTQGFSLGLNYYFKNYYQLSANYSWNKLNSAVDDPIIPAFNTPRNKFNIGFSGRDLPLKIGQNRKAWGFNLTYKWIEGFSFEGSPQFTGNIPTYSLVDAQANVRFPKQNLTVKLGASNLLDNKQFQAYGGPRIGRMAYLSLLYDFIEK